MPKPLQLTLSDADQRALEHVRDRDSEPHMREKAAALLKIAAGQQRPGDASDAGKQIHPLDDLTHAAARPRCRPQHGLVLSTRLVLPSI